MLDYLDLPDAEDVQEITITHDRVIVTLLTTVTHEIGAVEPDLDYDAEGESLGPDEFASLQDAQRAVQRGTIRPR